MPIGTAAAIALAAAAAGGVAKGAIDSNTADKNNQNAKDLATINRIPTVTNDFGSQMAEDPLNAQKRNLSLLNRPIKFNGQNF